MSAAVFILVAACGGGGLFHSADDRALEKALVRAGGEGRALRLREVARFSWDEVYILRGGLRGSRIREITGQAVVPDDEWYHNEDGALLVFVDGGKAVRAMQAAPNRLVAAGPSENGGGRTRWDRDVVIEPNGTIRDG
ncbi:hypothetical protein [Spirillospora sp. NPDC029432]|uniref:hypothetical protein n=1 Tax=Spirillospora sp. NPDC029432 TaxID=3154599 RepID=UPI003451DFE1